MSTGRSSHGDHLKQQEESHQNKFPPSTPTRLQYAHTQAQFSTLGLFSLASRYELDVLLFQLYWFQCFVPILHVGAHVHAHDYELVYNERVPHCVYIQMGLGNTRRRHSKHPRPPNVHRPRLKLHTLSVSVPLSQCNAEEVRRESPVPPQCHGKRGPKVSLYQLNVVLLL